MCLLHLSWASRDQTTFCRTFESYVGALSDHWLKTRSTGADVAGTLKIFSNKGRKTVSFVSLVNSRTLSTRPRPRTIEIVLEDPRGQGHVLEDSITGLYNNCLVWGCGLLYHKYTQAKTLEGNFHITGSVNSTPYFGRTCSGIYALSKTPILCTQ